MTGQLSLRRILAVLTVVLWILFAGEVAGAQSDATLDPLTGVVKAGDVVAVTGSGWPAGQMVSASICGRAGVNGSAYCNLQSASVFPVTRDGFLIGRATVAVPTEPCPCVLQVFAAGAGTTKATPIEIEGAPYAELPPGISVPSGDSSDTPERVAADPTPTLRIDSATIEDTSSWSALFGAPSGRRLRLTVTNTGVLAVRNPFLSVRYGKSGGPSFVVDAPQLEVVAAGETVAIDVPFELSALSFGDYTVDGDIGVVGNRVPFRGETSQWPWGLLVVAVLAVQLLVLWILRRNRRIRRRREAELARAEADAESVTAGTDTEPVGAQVMLRVASEEPAEGPTATDPTSAVPDHIPPPNVRLEGPVTAAPWH